LQLNKNERRNDVPNLSGRNVYNSTRVVFMKHTRLWLQTQQLRAVHYSILNLQSSTYILISI